MQIDQNKLYLGDNLQFLKRIEDSTIDLVYIDPPFNSNREYFKEDVTFADKFKSISHYIEWIRPRIAQINRVLKETGSFYLHCDKNASHYLKVLCDDVFGESNFRCEIIWIRTTHPHSISRSFDTITDNILFYTKSDNYKFHTAYRKPGKKEKKTFNIKEEETGRWFKHASLESGMNKSNKDEPRFINGKKITTKLGWKWTQETLNTRLKKNPHLIYWTKNGRARYKLYLDDFKGYKVHNLWDDIAPLDSNSQDHIYATQKPVELLKRIIKVSTDPDDLVLDCFCGSGTTAVAAKELGRNFICIDESEEAIHIANGRLKTYQTHIDGFFH